jgi:hypothetical protein
MYALSCCKTVHSSGSLLALLWGGYLVLVFDSQNRNPSKINPESLSHFSGLKTDHQSTTFYHAFHREFTTKAPRFDTRFCQNPLQNKQTHHQQ